MNVLAFRRTTQGFTSLFEKLETLITERLKVVTPEDFVLEVIDALQDVLSKSTSMELWGAAGLVDNIVNQFTKKGLPVSLCRKARTTTLYQTGCFFHRKFLQDCIDKYNDMDVLVPKDEVVANSLSFLNRLILMCRWNAGIEDSDLEELLQSNDLVRPYVLASALAADTATKRKAAALLDGERPAKRARYSYDGEIQVIPAQDNRSGAALSIQKREQQWSGLVTSLMAEKEELKQKVEGLTAMLSEKEAEKAKISEALEDAQSAQWKDGWTIKNLRFDLRESINTGKKTVAALAKAKEENAQLSRTAEAGQAERAHYARVVAKLSQVKKERNEARNQLASAKEVWTSHADQVCEFKRAFHKQYQDLSRMTSEMLAEL